jgi:hypothetical protein
MSIVLTRIRVAKIRRREEAYRGDQEKRGRRAIED